MSNTQAGFLLKCITNTRTFCVAASITHHFAAVIVPHLIKMNSHEGAPTPSHNKHDMFKLSSNVSYLSSCLSHNAKLLRNCMCVAAVQTCTELLCLLSHPSPEYRFLSFYECVWADNLLLCCSSVKGRLQRKSEPKCADILLSSCLKTAFVYNSGVMIHQYQRPQYCILIDDKRTVTPKLLSLLQVQHDELSHCRFPGAHSSQQCGGNKLYWTDSKIWVWHPNNVFIY